MTEIKFSSFAGAASILENQLHSFPKVCATFFNRFTLTVGTFNFRTLRNEPVTVALDDRRKFQSCVIPAELQHRLNTSSAQEFQGRFFANHPGESRSLPACSVRPLHEFARSRHNQEDQESKPRILLLWAQSLPDTSLLETCLFQNAVQRTGSQVIVWLARNGYETSLS